jgi:hypothetical protein
VTGRDDDVAVDVVTVALLQAASRTNKATKGQDRVCIPMSDVTTQRSSSRRDLTALISSEVRRDIT